MNYYLLKPVADAHADELRRAALIAQHRAAAREAARHAAPMPAPAVTLRFAAPDDTPALRRLAALDSSEVPAGPVLLAEVGGELRAAMSLCGRAIIADPFHPTEALVQLLVTRAQQMLGDRWPMLRRRRRNAPGRVRQHRASAQLTGVDARSFR